MSDKKYRRRNYLIDKPFQLKYTLAIVAMLLVVMLVSGIGLYMGMWGAIIENFSKFKVSEDLETAKRIAGYEEARYKRGDIRLEKIFREAELLSQKEQEALHEALRCVNRKLIPKILLIALLVFIAGIFVSHKIAGPMYRFEKSARAISEGDLSVNFKIRKNDEMKKAAMTLEEMLAHLRRDIEALKAANASLKEISAFLLKEPSQVKSSAILRETINEIDAILAKYKV